MEKLSFKLVFLGALLMFLLGVGRRGRGRDGDGWQGRGSEGRLSPSSCLGFQRGRGRGRWTDSDSLQPPQICRFAIRPIWGV
ncbi:hypothetical protein SLEP1_g48603 [Rubroshorea leprosula]|uniref:Secreted protein n=1 Tax=Rubroshorea leprosula TaxID=152421 RepID=A0AAV5LX64_9ROSI|nr:hypothetical protein SLEP1_g48603 [Rubroshorea leprosula]